MNSHCIRFFILYSLPLTQRMSKYKGKEFRLTDYDLEQLHINRMRRILTIASSRANDVVILGAFGCGAFKNPPEVVARAMKKVVQEFRNYFHVIEFAVYCSPRDEQSYTVFKKILGEGQ